MGQFTWTPTWDQASGSYRIAVHIDDPFDPALQDVQTFTITVSDSAPVSYIRALYHDVLGRAADPASLISWVELLQTGAARTFVAAAIWTSSEHLGIEVDQLYATYLHRTADETGRAGWVSALQMGMTLPG